MGLCVCWRRLARRAGTGRRNGAGHDGWVQARERNVYGQEAGRARRREEAGTTALGMPGGGRGRGHWHALALAGMKGGVKCTRHRRGAVHVDAGRMGGGAKGAGAVAGRLQGFQTIPLSQLLLAAPKLARQLSLSCRTCHFTDLSALSRNLYPLPSQALARAS